MYAHSAIWRCMPTLFIQHSPLSSPLSLPILLMGPLGANGTRSVGKGDEVLQFPSFHKKFRIHILLLHFCSSLNL